MAGTSRDEAYKVAHRARLRESFDHSPRGEAGHRLASVLDDQYYANLRAAKRVPLPGNGYGDIYGPRWEKVERIVTRHNDAAVATAHATALRSGWTEAELAAAGLSPSV